MFFKWKRKYKKLKEEYDELLEKSVIVAQQNIDLVTACKNKDKIIDSLDNDNKVFKKDYEDLQEKYKELEENKYPTHFVLKETLTRPVILTTRMKVDFREDLECVKEIGTQYAIEDIAQKIIKDNLYLCEQSYDYRYDQTILTYMVTVSNPNP